MDALDIEGWHKSRDVALEITRTMIEKFLLYKKQSLVLVDDTFEYSSMRKAYYQIAREYSVLYGELHLTCPLETAVERN